MVSSSNFKLVIISVSCILMIVGSSVTSTVNMLPCDFVAQDLSIEDRPDGQNVAHQKPSSENKLYLTEKYEISPESMTYELPSIEGAGKNLTGSAIYSTDQSRVIATSTDNVTISDSPEGCDIHVACDIDSVSGLAGEDIVSGGTFPTWALGIYNVLPYGWSGETGVVFGSPILDWNGQSLEPNIMMEEWFGDICVDYLRQNILGGWYCGVHAGWCKASVTTSQVRSDVPIRSAFLQFDRNIVIQNWGFTATYDSLVKCSMDDQVLWSESYGWREDFDFSTGWESFSINVTDIVTPDESYKLEFYTASTCGTDLLTLSALFECSWDNIHLIVNYEVPTNDPEALYIVDPVLGTYNFDWRGHLEFDTTSTVLTFGPALQWFEANFTFTSTKSENLTTYYWLDPAVDHVRWQANYSYSNQTDWPLDRFVAQVPSNWVYQSSQEGSGWGFDSSTHTLWMRQTSWHCFTAKRVDPSCITVSLQSNGSIKQSPCNHFMRGEQFAITPNGTIGEYFLSIYSPSGDVELGNQSVGPGGTWLFDQDGEFLTIPSAAELGVYTVVVFFKYVNIGLNYTTFFVEEYEVEGLGVTENEDGTVTVGGMVSSNTTGTPRVYVASSIGDRGVAGDAVNIMISPDLYLYNFVIWDTIIDPQGDTFFGRFLIEMYEPEPFFNATIRLRCVNLVNPNLVIFDKNDTLEFGNYPQFGETANFDFEISPVGNNTMLRNGIYRLELSVVGNDEVIYVDEALPYYPYLYVAESPWEKSCVQTVHETELIGGFFSVTFAPDEVFTPENVSFIVIVEDENHITTGVSVTTLEYLQIHTEITEPVCIVNTNGALTIQAHFSGFPSHWQWDPSHWTDPDWQPPHQVDFFIDWGDGSESLGSVDVMPSSFIWIDVFHNDSGVSMPCINSTVSFLLDNPSGHSPASYEVQVAHTGTEVTKPCYAEGILSFETTDLTAQWSDTVAGGVANLSVLLEGTTLGPLEGKTVFFEISSNGQDWVDIGSATTNNNGWAAIEYPTTLESGNYTVRVSFNSTNFILSCVVESILTVTHQPMVTAALVGAPIGIGGFIAFVLWRRRRVESG